MPKQGAAAAAAAAVAAAACGQGMAAVHNFVHSFVQTHYRSLQLLGTNVAGPFLEAIVGS